MSAGAHRGAVGRLGESLAARFLVARGATVVGRNVRIGRGEIDLHVELDGESVAVEVKTVRAPTGLDPRIGFTPRKLTQVRALARHLEPPAYRVDLVAVELGPDGVGVRWMPHAT